MEDEPFAFEQQVLEVVDRWDRRLEIAAAAWAELPSAEQSRRGAELDAAGDTEEWVVVLWNWWIHASVAEQDRLRADVRVLAGGLSAAAAAGRLEGPSEEAAAGRHLLYALQRTAAILGIETTDR